MSGGHVLWTCRRTSGVVARIVLAESGLPHETRFVDLRAGEHRAERYLAVNPKGEVPALALPDGSVLTEGPAIHLYAARAMPGASCFATASSTTGTRSSAAPSWPGTAARASRSRRS